MDVLDVRWTFKQRCFFSRRYGIRVSVLVLPAPPLMTSSKALEFVGPKAFGYDNVDYHPVGEYKLYESITKVVD